MVPQVVPYCVTVGKVIEVALQARERRDFNICQNDLLPVAE